VFNVGSETNNYRLGRLAEEIAAAMPCDVRIEWYGDPDHRSYRVDFREIEALGWKAGLTARDGAAEIYERLESGALERTPQSITLAWYEQLVAWHRTIKEVELHGGILDV
jgi:hypothetical protein